MEGDLPIRSLSTPTAKGQTTQILHICLTQKQAIILAHSGKDKWRTMKPAKQRMPEEKEEWEKSRREAAENVGKGGQTQVAVAVEIP